MIHHFGPPNSGHFFLEPREKCSLKIKHLLGGDIRYSPNFRWILGLRTSAGAVHLGVFGIQTFPSPWPWPTAPLKVVNFLQLENSSNPARNGLQPTFMRFVFDGNHAVLYRWRRMSFAQQVGWNNASFRFWDANPWFSHCTGGGSIPRDLTVRWNHFWIFILNLCSLHRPLAAQSWVSIFAVLLMMLIRRGKDEETGNVHVLLCKIDIKNRRNCLPMTQIVIYKHWNSWFKNSL